MPNKIQIYIESKKQMEANLKHVPTYVYTHQPSIWIREF